LKEFP